MVIQSSHLVRASPRPIGEPRCYGELHDLWTHDQGEQTGAGPVACQPSAPREVELWMRAVTSRHGSSSRAVHPSTCWPDTILPAAPTGLMDISSARFETVQTRPKPVLLKRGAVKLLMMGRRVGYRPTVEPSEASFCWLCSASSLRPTQWRRHAQQDTERLIRGTRRAMGPRTWRSAGGIRRPTGGLSSRRSLGLGIPC